jgi:hypothetical protein
MLEEVMRIREQIRKRRENKMKTIVLKTIIVTLMIFLSSTVYAGCWYDGKEYPTGSQVNGRTCGYDGYWR